MATRRGCETIECIPAREPTSNDVWAPMTDVIDDWGLGEDDLWGRLVGRQEELLTVGGVHCNLYQQFNYGVRCTCQKDETKQVTQRCKMCFGTLFMGGYEKFGHTSVIIGPAASSVSVRRGDATPEASFTGAVGGTEGDGPELHDLVLQNKFPDQLVIADGKLSGYFLSPKFQLTCNLAFSEWLLIAQDGIRKLTQDQFLVEFSIDGGSTFHPMSDLDCLSNPSFVLQIRVTLTRAAVTDTSPYFQQVRFRFQTSQKTQIVISKKTFPEQRVLESFGVRVGMDGITWWTTPSMGLADGTKTYIQENDIFEILEGRYQKEPPSLEEYPDSGRFKPSNVSYVEPKGKFLSQRFNIRHLNIDEPGNKVF